MGRILVFPSLMEDWQYIRCAPAVHYEPHDYDKWGAPHERAAERGVNVLPFGVCWVPAVRGKKVSFTLRSLQALLGALVETRRWRARNGTPRPLPSPDLTPPPPSAWAPAGWRG